MPKTTSVHATCINIEGNGVLLMGEPGSGKSDLALRLIDRGATLVADDAVKLQQRDNKLFASAPNNIKGLLEMRGVGIVSLPHIDNIPLVLAVKLVSRAAVERWPEPQFFGCLGVELPLLSLYAHDASTDAKIRLFLSQKG